MDPFVLETIKKNKLSNKLHNFQRSSKSNLIVINSVKTDDNQIIFSNHDNYNKNENLVNLTKISPNNTESLKRTKGSPSRSSLKQSKPSPTIIRHNFNDSNQDSKFLKDKDIQMIRVENHLEKKCLPNDLLTNDLVSDKQNLILNDSMVESQDFANRPNVLIHKHSNQESEKINIKELNIIKKDIQPIFNTMAAAGPIIYTNINQLDSSNTITYKSTYFMLMTFILFMFTLLPIQYHNESFGIQMKRMQDQCNEALNHSNYIDHNVNQTYLLGKLFPFILTARSIKSNNEIMYNESVRNELAYLIDELIASQKRNNLNNLKIKYLTQQECYLNNFTKILNIIALKPAVLTTQTKRTNFDLLINENDQYEPIDDFTIPRINNVINNHIKRRQEFENKFEIYQKSFNHNTTIFNKNQNEFVLTNSILVCDDELYRKSILDKHQQEKLVNNIEYSKSGLVSSQDQSNNDFQENILTQWNITCQNFTNSIVTISYAQMTFLSGDIIGAIFFSMLADFIGRKKVYLATLYVSTIIGALASIVQTYRQFVLVRFPIAALTQGCFIVSYVLLFEMIIKSKNRNIYCSLFFSNVYVCNIVIAFMSRLIRDWRYLQLTGSLMSSIAIGYPWIIKESFKWLIVRDNFAKAEKVCKSIFKENGIVARLLKMKLDDQLNDDFENKNISNNNGVNNYWPMVIWQPTFRKIICCFVMMWSILSLTNFFIMEDNLDITRNNINNYSIENGILFVFNVGLSLLYFRFGKRIPLGSCMFLGGSLYLASSLINQDARFYWIKMVFHLISKSLVSCAINILMLYVCELFPCEIRCSSFSFFLSIRHLSEMLAIYLFKVNMLSMSVVKIGLSIFCVLLCICALILPERNSFSFNLDYLEYLNRNRSFVLNGLSSNAAKKNTCKINDIDAYDEMNESPSASSDNFDEKNVERDETDSMEENTTNINNILNNDNLKLQQDQLSPSRFFKIGTAANTKTMVINETKVKVDQDNESVLLANTLIKKINCENHCKTGKLNPLYEEEPILNNLTSSSSNMSHSRLITSSSNNLTTFINSTPPLPIRKIKNSKVINDNNVLIVRESATKF